MTRKGPIVLALLIALVPAIGCAIFSHWMGLTRIWPGVLVALALSPNVAWQTHRLLTLKGGGR